MCSLFSKLFFNEWTSYSTHIVLWWTFYACWYKRRDVSLLFCVYLAKLCSRIAACARSFSRRVCFLGVSVTLPCPCHRFPRAKPKNKTVRVTWNFKKLKEVVKHSLLSISTLCVVNMLLGEKNNWCVIDEGELAWECVPRQGVSGKGSWSVWARSPHRQFQVLNLEVEVFLFQVTTAKIESHQDAAFWPT